METVTQTKLQQVANAFETFRTLAGFGLINSETDYERAIALTEAILDTTRQTSSREDTSAPLSILLDWAAEAIRIYEATHVCLPAASPREVLRFLMEQHGLSQSDLPEVGNQSVVSQILSGQRALNTRQIAALSARFKVSTDAFIEYQRLAA